MVLSIDPEIKAQGEGRFIYRDPFTFNAFIQLEITLGEAWP